MSDLRAIAKAATPGPWRELIWDYGEDDRPGTMFVTADPIDTQAALAVGLSEADAAHIAAWSPDRALAALDVIEAAGQVARTDAMSQPKRTAATNALRDALARWEALG